MTDVGKKVAAGALQLMHLGHVASHHQPLAFAVGHHTEFHVVLVIQHQRKRLIEITLP